MSGGGGRERMTQAEYERRRSIYQVGLINPYVFNQPEIVPDAQDPEKPTAPPPPPTPDTPEVVAKVDAAQTEVRKQAAKGRASTILTRPKQFLDSGGTTSRKVLLGS